MLQSCLSGFSALCIILLKQESELLFLVRGNINSVTDVFFLEPVESQLVSCTAVFWNLTLNKLTWILFCKKRLHAKRFVKKNPSLSLPMRRCRGERVRASVWEPEGTPVCGEHEGQCGQRPRTTWDPQQLDQPHSKKPLFGSTVNLIPALLCSLPSSPELTAVYYIHIKETTNTTILLHRWWR